MNPNVIPISSSHEKVPDVPESSLGGFAVSPFRPVSEEAPVLERLGSFCAPTGRAAGHGCAVATNSFTMAGGTLMLGDWMRLG